MAELAEHGWLSERKQSRIHLYLVTKQIVFVPLTHTASLSANLPAHPTVLGVHVSSSESSVLSSTLKLSSRFIYEHGCVYVYILNHRHIIILRKLFILKYIIQELLVTNNSSE